jgi:hypothetical protein
MTTPKSATDEAEERLRASLRASKPPTGGVPLDEVANELVPLLPLLTELPAERRQSGDFESFEFRECFTVLTLVGRRLALRDLTPTSAISVLERALRSVDVSPDSGPGPFEARALAAAIEGFVLGREERVAELAAERAAKTLKPVRMDDSLFALLISGVHEPAVLSDCVDALGRAMLDADVDRAIVDLSQLGEPNRDRAVAIFSADEVARMLGGRCFFTGVDARWRAAAADARIPLDALDLVPSLGGALRAAAERSDRRPRGRFSSWWARLRRLRS